MKPRWKSIVELIVGLVFMFVGADMATRALAGEVVLVVVSGWPAVVLAVLITIGGIGQAKQAWAEL